ncbi:FliM/FliN family flagellar motor switch protein [Pseudomonas syringae]|uniref:Flagellar motor switch/type III secretory pathway protein FliN n=1 Tax=Pseudomonas syringae pv. actinidiae TaxID=103796 RepID=A0A2V0QNT8_PSESF|nr:FliM/FliN family flagellar motor switch protein [Pseudomonas syringae]EPM92585.1 type III secretion protein HrcQb [Pseudomonas syringae pv. actinidiae ICMP 19070]AQL39078.1 type III secretion system protein [Pseudomonas syringae pv. actinidiae ICMP 9853]EGH63314.1 type III secretion protein HrcQb [Pseudomonas syringae pv. actinidiae str. M302091]EPM63395.1 type III secretion protein HrcQb [Pseudomonas syringae pv. actinidiae ICMP 19103]EPM90357.1 type III secretion protein HrcQb [Pseudomona
MSTEDLYQDDVESLDDYDDETADQEHEQQWAEPDDESDYAEAEPDDDEQEEQEEQQVPSGLDSLALDLTLRCGELRLTLAELRGLDAGTILEVGGVAPGYATLCHGERVVAEGELVDVDGRLGLQITRLAAQP